MQADEVGRARKGRGQAGDRQGRGIAGEDGGLRNDRIGLLRDFGLDRAGFEHRFDHQVAARQIGVVGRRPDVLQLRIDLGLRRLAALQSLLQQRDRQLLALLRHLLRAVEQHHLDTGSRRNLGDARAHHAGAEDAELLHLAGGHAVRASCQLVGGVLVDEQGAHQVARHRAGQELAEIFRLHLERGIHRQQGAFVQAGQDGQRRGQVALGVLRRHRRAHGEADGGVAGSRAGAAGNAIALFVPGLHRLGRFEQPLAGEAGEFGGGRHRVHHAELQGLRRLQRLAAEQDGTSLLDADQARQALRAACAGQQAEVHFGQADAGVLRQHTVVAGQRHFEAAAQGQAVDGTGHWFAAGLQPAQQTAQILAQLGALLCADAGGEAVHQVLDVGAGDEGAGLARGDDGALDGGIAGQGLHRGGEVALELRGEHVHRPAGDVDGDGGDAVRIHRVGQGLHAGEVRRAR